MQRLLDTVTNNRLRADVLKNSLNRGVQYVLAAAWMLDNA